MPNHGTQHYSRQWHALIEQVDEMVLDSEKTLRELRQLDGSAFKKYARDWEKRVRDLAKFKSHLEALSQFLDGELRQERQAGYVVVEVEDTLTLGQRLEALPE